MWYPPPPHIALDFPAVEYPPNLPACFLHEVNNRQTKHNMLQPRQNDYTWCFIIESNDNELSTMKHQVRALANLG